MHGSRKISANLRIKATIAQTAQTMKGDPALQKNGLSHRMFYENGPVLDYRSLSTFSDEDFIIALDVFIFKKYPQQERIDRHIRLLRKLVNRRIYVLFRMLTFSARKRNVFVRNILFPVV